eukprot:TRINITY_DN10988_c0_g1_i1.p1 TRINITY_DN10988_c0_g1~~TRINITY_DN10988_c0_g1_i1.p1  ORF type:complete len:572 (-),score=50.97 TRINITY_DN10988_c0_g1_i1:5-1720(-)
MRLLPPDVWSQVVRNLPPQERHAARFVNRELYVLLLAADSTLLVNLMHTPKCKLDPSDSLPWWGRSALSLELHLPLSREVELDESVGKALSSLAENLLFVRSIRLEAPRRIRNRLAAMCSVGWANPGRPLDIIARCDLAPNFACEIAAHQPELPALALRPSFTALMLLPARLRGLIKLELGPPLGNCGLELVCTFLQSFTALEALTLENRFCTEDILQSVAQLPRLRTLCCYGLEEQQLRAVHAVFRAKKTDLSIDVTRSCATLSEPVVQILQDCPGITELSGWQIAEPAHLQGLGAASHLRTLHSVWHCGEVPETVHIASLPRLETLVLTNRNPILPNEKVLTTLFRNLRRVELHGISAARLAMLFLSLPELRQCEILSVEDPSIHSDLAQAIARNKNLSSISIEFAVDESVLFFEGLSQATRRVIYVTASFYRVRPVAACFAAQNLPFVKVHGALDAECLAILAQSSASTLRSIDLVLTPEVEDTEHIAAFSDLCQRCSNLSDISFSSGAATRELATISLWCAAASACGTRLRALQIWFDVTEVSITSVKQKCPWAQVCICGGIDVDSM